MKHYHAMNGSHGCLPDSNEIFTSKESAIGYLVDMFQDTDIRGMKTSLRSCGAFEFPNRHEVGADFCEVICCTDSDCSNIE